MRPMPPDDEEDSRAPSMFEQTFGGLVGFLSVVILAVVVLLMSFCQARAAECKVAWDANPEPNILGYVVLVDGKELSAGNATTITLDLPAGTHCFAVRAVNSLLLISPWSAPIYHTVSDITPIARASSVAPLYPIANMIDGDHATIFASFYEPAPQMQWIEIEYGEERWANAVSWLPRQDDFLQYGYLTTYQIYADGQRVAEGSVDVMDASEKLLPFPKCKARRWRIQGAVTHLVCAELTIRECAPAMMRFSFQYGEDLAGWEDLPPFDRPKRQGGFVRWKCTELP